MCFHTERQLFRFFFISILLKLIKYGKHLKCHSGEQEKATIVSFVVLLSS